MTGFGPALDLVIERETALPAAPLWACRTRPALPERRFCPLPWRATDGEIDLRPGGRFNSVIRGPDSEAMPGRGCCLEVAPERRLAWTGALTEGFRPGSAPFFTGVITFDPVAGGTRYRAVALHATARARERHAAKGFAGGGNRATDRLVALARTLTP